MHIKFINRGKGSAHIASSYVLGTHDHNGIVRKGVDVLRGDAQIFNTFCDASPHLWKYTSGVIAWSKEDAPTDEQIQEVLNEFEKHAFAGLDKDQYHLFAVQHTDQDGSKHIHVLVPRIDIQSGKSLNIAPPNHQKHFDPLRDYFNAKYDWSRPDDLLLSRDIQEPHHIAKINAQAKRIFESDDLNKITNKQFRQKVNNLVTTYLKNLDIENRADIVQVLNSTSGIEAIEEHDTYLKVTRTNGKTVRLKGDFYNEKFEIGTYTEHLRAEAERRRMPSEFREVLRELEENKHDVRSERELYNRKHYESKRAVDDSNELNQLIAHLTDNRISNKPNQSNQYAKSDIKEFRYIANIDNTGQIQHLVFNSRKPTNENRYSNIEFQPRPSTNQQNIRERNNQNIEYARTNSEVLEQGVFNRRSRDTYISNVYMDHMRNRFFNNGITKKFLVFTPCTTPINNLNRESISEIRNQPILNNTSPITERTNRRSEEIERIIETGKQIAARTKRLIDRTEHTINRSLTDLKRSELQLCSELQRMRGIERTVQNKLRGNHTESNQRNEFFIAFGRFNTSTCVQFNNRIGRTNQAENTFDGQQQYRTVSSGIKAINIPSIINRVQGNFNTGFEQSNNAIRAFSQRTNQLAEQVGNLNKDIELNGLKINVMPLLNKLKNRHGGIKEDAYGRTTDYFHFCEFFDNTLTLKKIDSNKSGDIYKAINGKIGSYFSLIYNLENLVEYGHSYGVFLNKNDLMDIKNLLKISLLDIKQIELRDYPKYAESILIENRVSDPHNYIKDVKENLFRDTETKAKNFLVVLDEQIESYNPSQVIKQLNEYNLELKSQRNNDNNRGYDSPTPSF